MRIEPIETDLLIVGSGFAGLWAAISARQAGVGRVAVVDKAAIAMSSQSRLCAGATIYCLPEDDAEAWLRNIVEANGFLSRRTCFACELDCLKGAIYVGPMRKPRLQSG